MMNTVDQLKKELKDLPEETLDELDRYIHVLRRHDRRRKKLPTYHLQGRYDTIAMRNAAYE